MCRLQSFVHAYCHCRSYDLRLCRKLPRQCPSCPSPRQSKYIIQPEGSASFIPESLSACPSLNKNPIQLHPLPCQIHMRQISPETRREIFLGEIQIPRPDALSRSSGDSDDDDDEDSDRESIRVDASGRVRKVDKDLFNGRPGVATEPANSSVVSESFSIGLSERLCEDGAWRERSVAEILEDGRVEDGEGGFRRERVELLRKKNPRPWYWPCRWIWGKY